MQEDILLQISNKIKGARKGKHATVQELASRAHVSKGLIRKWRITGLFPRCLFCWGSSGIEPGPERLLPGHRPIGQGSQGHNQKAFRISAI